MSARSFRRSHAKRLDRERRRLSNAKRRALVVGATLGATAAFAANAEAATYTVNSTADTGTGTCAPSPGVCTLRDAITQADSSGVAGTPDTITFDSSVTGKITLGQGDLVITDPGGLAIQGPGAGALTVSAAGASRIFDVNPTGHPDVTISGLTLTQGYALGSGGAIYDRSSPLTLSGDTISGSRATATGGGVGSKYDVKVTDSTISGNSTGGGQSPPVGGAGVAVLGTAALSITDSKIDGNTDQSTNAGGGILDIGGSVSLTGSQVTNNRTQGAGGGVAAQTKYGTTIDGSTVSGNFAADGGGVSLYGSQLGGTPTQDPIVVSNSTISQNQAPKGAGIDVGPTQGNSPVTIKASTISGNNNQGGSSPSSGGGILISGTLYNPFDVVDSTITGNSATDGGGVSLSYAGDGTPLVGTDSTTGNSGSIAFDNSTIDGNTAYTHGGGIYLAAYNPQTDPSGSADLNSTIVANDSANGAPNDLYQGDTTNGGIHAAFSLIQNPGNAVMLSSQALITGVDPQLNALANNGGPTETMLPKDTSPVIDQGKAQSGLTTDQRGDPRTVDNGKTKPPGGDGTDIGAVELAKIPPPPPGKPPAPNPISDTAGPTSGITNNSATLHGTINTNGQAVTWHFEYGTTTGGAGDARDRGSADPVTSTQSISAGHGSVPVSVKVTGLKPGTHYHYRVVAVSGSGQTAISGYATFTTAKPTIHVSPGAERGAHAVRVFGSAGACTRGSRVVLTSGAFSSAHKFKGHHAVYTKVGKGGKYSVVTRIPAGRKPGRYAITARCDGTVFGVTAFLRVLPPPPVVKFTG